MALAPSELSDVGQRKWDEWIEILRSHNLLDARYLDALLVYCKAWERLIACEAVLKRDGDYQKSQGGWKAHPALIERRNLVEQIRKYQQEFGFTPSSAARAVAALPAAKTSSIPTRQRELA